MHRPVYLSFLFAATKLLATLVYGTFAKGESPGMSRQGYHHWSIHLAGRRSGRRAVKRHSTHRPARRRQLGVELLEVRNLLAALEVSPFPLDETFLLNSLPGATKTIYLDFDGHEAENTQWNVESGRPFIQTPAFNLPDDDLNTFSATERLLFQRIWERVAEDFRPFEVNVTTQDPTIADPGALDNSGAGDQTWGIRIVIGGDSRNDWFTSTGGQLDLGGAVKQDSFSANTPAYIFGLDRVTVPPPPAPPLDLLSVELGIAATTSHLVGHSLGLSHDGQVRYYQNSADNFKWESQFYPLYEGHGTGATSWAPIMGTAGKELSQWSRGEYYNATQTQDDLAIITGPANGFGFRPDDHGSAIDDTTALELDPTLTQFSGEGIIEENTDVDWFSFVVEEEGELLTLDIVPFHKGPNLDVLARIYDASGIERYRSNPLDDIQAGSQSHGSFEDGGWAQLDALGNLSNYVSEVFLTRGTYFLTVEGAGRPITFIDSTVHPGPIVRDPENDPMPPDTSDWGYSNYGSLGYYSISGTRKGRLLAGVDFDVAGGVSPSGWKLFSGGGSQEVLRDLPIETSDPPYEYMTYSVGTARVLNGVVSLFGGGAWPAWAASAEFVFEGTTYSVASRNSDTEITLDDTTLNQLVPTSYELRFGTITVVDGVVTMTGDTRWPAWAEDAYLVVAGTSYSIASRDSSTQYTLDDTTLNLPTGTPYELRFGTTYDLTISTTGTALTTVASTAPIDSGALPDHSLPLDGLNGYLPAASGEILTFVWSDLVPEDVYQVFVFGHANTEAHNAITVKGGYWNGEAEQTYEFTQTLAAGGLAVNGEDEPGGIDMPTLSLLVIANEAGEITIDVTGADGFDAGVAGLAIARTELGSIAGQKWNDDGGGDPSNAGNGGGQADPGEQGLAGWMLYLDLNNNGILDADITEDRTVTVEAPEVPQDLLDYATVKNDLIFEEDGIIQDVTVTLDITHTYDADLNVWLIGPDLTEVKLVADRGGNLDNFTNTTFDDSATIAIGDAAAPFTGTFRPEQPLSSFVGKNSAGKWTLKIQDDGPGDIGVLNSWSVAITLEGATTYLEPIQVSDNQGNYLFPDLKPGVYFVREHIQEEQQLDGWRQSWAPPKVLVTSGGDITGVDFGNWIPIFTPGEIGGQKWHDVDGNGVKDAGDVGLEGWVIFFDSNNNGIRDVGADDTEYQADDLPQQITDFSTVTSTVLIDDADLGSIIDLEVTLDITHTFMADLEAFLTSPTGRIVELFTGVGGQFNNFSNVTFRDDPNLRSIDTIGQADLQPGIGYTGEWRPEGSLGEFFGDDAEGLWTLTIRDTTFADEGTLNSWSLSVTTGERFTTTDENGNYTFGNLPAGQYIIQEEMQPGWVQTLGPTMFDDGLGNFHNVVVVAGSVTQVDFGNTNAGPDRPGDYNRDAIVDAADYVFFRKFLTSPASSVPNPYDGPDGDGSSAVDPADRDVWEENFGAGNPILQVAQPDPPGDYNRETTVDAADYVVFRKFLTTAVPVAYAGADGNGNRIVDPGDRDVWVEHFGEVPVGGGSGFAASSAARAAVGVNNASSYSPAVAESPVTEAPTTAEVVGNETTSFSANILFSIVSTPADKSVDLPIENRQADLIGGTVNDAAILALLDSFTDNSPGFDSESQSKSDREGDDFASNEEFDEDLYGVDALFELIGA
jgi:subtilisin-like proprotein convertase family protein